MPSGEGLTSFSINNRTHFLGEKNKMKLSRVSLFFGETRAKTFKLNVLLVLVLKLSSNSAESILSVA